LNDPAIGVELALSLAVAVSRIKMPESGMIQSAPRRYSSAI
jgi:hypothetical protein